MFESNEVIMVAVIAIIGIGVLALTQGNATGAQIMGEGATYPGERHSCGGNIIGFDVPTYYATSTYYECFVCPGDGVQAQTHAMCRYWPLPYQPAGGPREPFSSY